MTVKQLGFDTVQYDQQRRDRTETAIAKHFSPRKLTMLLVQRAAAVNTAYEMTSIVVKLSIVATQNTEILSSEEQG